ANAVVQMIRQDVSRTYQTKTDKRGSYYYDSLPLGFYAVKIVVEGQDAAGVVGLRTQPGTPIEVNFDLGVAPQEQESRIKMSLRKSGAEWSYVKIMAIQPAQTAAAATAAAPPAEVPKAPIATGPPQTNREAMRLFNEGRAAMDAKKYAEAVASFSKAT